MTAPGIALCAAMALGSNAATVPEWLHLLPAGDVRTQDGRGPYRVADMPSLIAVSMAGGKLVLDENHATDLAAPKGLPAPALGWIVQLQQRSDGLWGQVQWTEAAKRAETWRAYRGVSPVIVHTKDGTVTAVARASLTNTPNLTGLTALHHAEMTMNLRANIVGLLGLHSTADDATIESKLKQVLGQSDGKVVSAQSAMAQGQELARQAALYQGRMKKDGITITHAVAVRAVQDGTASK